MSFAICRSTSLSLMGVKRSGRMEAYHGVHGRSSLEIKTGVHSKEEIIGAAETGNSLLKWGLRMLGTLLMYFGVYMFFEVFLYYITWIPLLEPLLDTAASVVSGLIAIPLSLLTMVIAWVFYRPWALALFLAVVVAFIAYRIH